MEMQIHVDIICSGYVIPADWGLILYVYKYEVTLYVSPIEKIHIWLTFRIGHHF